MVQRIEQPGAELTLGYWGIRGLAQPVRFLLAFVEVPFSEVRLGVDANGSIMSKNQEDADWNPVRITLDTPFPNLPYLIDSSGSSPVTITQSNAILRYLARRFDLYGDAELERIEIDVLQDEAYDFRNKIIGAAYTLGDGYPAAFTEFTEVAVPRYLDGFEQYLVKRDTNTHFVGSRISVVDFILYELIWQMTCMVPNSVTEKHRPNLFAFIECFAQQANIARYMTSRDFIERPINSPWASFA